MTMLTLPTVIRAASAAEPQPADTRQAHWKRIEYPYFPIPGANGQTMTVVIGSEGEGGLQGESQHLRFDLLWSGRDDVEKPAALAHPETIIVRLHLSDGSTVDPEKDEYPGWLGFGNGHFTTFSRPYIFP